MPEPASRVAATSPGSLSRTVAGWPMSTPWRPVRMSTSAAPIPPQGIVAWMPGLCPPGRWTRPPVSAQWSRVPESTSNALIPFCGNARRNRVPGPWMNGAWIQYPGKGASSPGPGWRNTARRRRWPNGNPARHPGGKRRPASARRKRSINRVWLFHHPDMQQGPVWGPAVDAAVPRQRSA